MKIIIKFINLCSKIFEVIEFIIEILENFLCSGKPSSSRNQYPHVDIWKYRLAFKLNSTRCLKLFILRLVKMK